MSNKPQPSNTKGPMKSQFIIAAPSSNAGKTSLTLGLLRALQKRGSSVQAFKCGPDYIDPKFHRIACATPSLNLDLIMMPIEHLKSTYSQYAGIAEVSVIEGVMGLFDGAIRSEGSTAALSKTLGLPIILIVDAKATAYSVAPLLYGFKNFDPELHLAGVIFNRVNSESHYRFLQEACEDAGLRSFGRIPFIEDAGIPSRHLGLSLEHLQSAEEAIDKISHCIEETVLLDDLLWATRSPLPTAKPILTTTPSPPLKVAIARDEAFDFTYLQNLRRFEQQGEVTFFSPLEDKQVPKADLLYLPGGYPELYAAQLSQNSAMRRAISEFIANGGKTLAECGGLMYLGEHLEDKEGNTFEMVGALPLSTSMKPMKLNLGYRKIDLEAGTLMGHEFHYSSCTTKATLDTIGRVSNIRGMDVTTKLYRQNTVLASYIHLYFGDNDQFRTMMNLLSLSL